MMPGTAHEPAEVRIEKLALAATESKLVLFVGAGVSVEDPSGLPTGASLAILAQELLRDRFPAVADCLGGDLPCIGDKVQAEGQGAYLQQEILRLAEFDTAPPNKSHRLLALIVCEGVARVLTANWDTRIERVGPNDERIEVVRSEADYSDAQGALLLKVHGCARRPQTLLISNTDLANPPLWVRDEINSKLHSYLIVFLGLGAIPPHSKRRVKELIEEAGRDRVLVVSRSIGAEWDELLGEQASAAAYQADAEEFLSQLTDAYVAEVDTALRLMAMDHDAAGTYSGLPTSVVDAVQTVMEALRHSSGGEVISWGRRAAINWESGTPVVSADSMKRTLLAVALLTAGTTVRFDGRALNSGGNGLVILLSRGLPSPTLMARAERRIEDVVGGAEYPEGVMVLSAGHQGPLPRDRDIVGPIDSSEAEGSDDIVVGPMLTMPRVLSVEDVLAGDRSAATGGRDANA